MASKFSKINTLWQAIGGAIFAPILVMLLIIDYFNYGYLSGYQSLLWLNLAFLFFHELEDYILNPNGFKRFFNSYSVFAIKPHKTNEPLSEKVIFTVNALAWAWAILAAVFAKQLPWLGISFLITNSLINCFSHTVLFQLSHKSYNPGLITVIFLFIPLYTAILWYTIAFSILTASGWAIGIILGIAMTLLMSSSIKSKTVK
ncbi:MAG: HXXEE domain-containing protein [Chlamydiae bacterium]|nr:HXXEE domain-containing protein [Chlamydiota bacterium]